MLFFFFFYQAFLIATFPLFLCYLLTRKLRKKIVFGNFFERIGLVPLPTLKKTTSANKTSSIIWLHAVSVGEVLSLQRLIKKIKQKDPSAICYLTVGTLTGKEMAKKNLEADHISFLPYDYLPAMLLAFSRIKPSSIIITEAELWPNLLLLAHYKKIPTYLINARISKRSKKRYHSLARIIVPLLSTFQKIYTQSNYDKNEFKALGLAEKKLSVMGNIKAPTVLEKQNAITVTPKPKVPILLVGSIHPGELEPHLSTFANLKKEYPSLKLILAPRHFHWKKYLIEKTAKLGYNVTIWQETPLSEKELPKNLSQTTTCPQTTSWEILLVCKLGELFQLYHHATIFFLGGTFVPIGGHNLLEPAVWSTPTIIGPHHHNCKVTAQELQNHHALLIAENKTQLLEQTKHLLNHSTECATMGNNAKTWLEQEASLIEKNLDELLKKIL